jgi:hypothetical protein
MVKDKAILRRLLRYALQALFQIRIKGDSGMNVFRLSVMVAILSALSLANLAGCCGPGGGANVETKNITTTKSLGDQLIDLKKAYESGAITEDQYNDLKQKTIQQNTGEK